MAEAEILMRISLGLVGEGIDNVLRAMDGMPPSVEAPSSWIACMVSGSVMVIGMVIVVVIEIVGFWLDPYLGSGSGRAATPVAL